MCVREYSLACSVAVGMEDSSAVFSKPRPLFVSDDDSNYFTAWCGMVYKRSISAVALSHSACATDCLNRQTFLLMY